MARPSFGTRSAPFALCVALVFPAPAPRAQEFPARPVRVVVPFTPGGSSDIVARLLTQKLVEFWGQPFVIDNRPGAGGAVGAETVAKAVPDGYTILLTNPGPGLHNPLLRRNPPYTLADFSPVIYIGYTPNIIVAQTRLPAADLPQLLAHARASPGRVNWASPGVASNPHVALERLRAATGIDVVHVPYKGVAQALADLLGGQVDAVYTTYISAESHIRAGRVRVLGVSGVKRMPALPETPTFTEQGVPAADSTLWVGFVTAARAPQSAIGRLNTGANRALQSPEVRARFEQLNVEIEGGMPEKFSAFIAREARRLAPLARSGTLQLD